MTAPLTARVASAAVKPGDVVAADDVLLVLEAMKTETAIRTHEDGVVAQVRCQPNDVVNAGQVLVVISPNHSGT